MRLVSSKKKKALFSWAQRAGSRWEPITGAAQLAVPEGRWAARRLNHGHLTLESSSCSADLIHLFEIDAQIHATPRFSSSVVQQQRGSAAFRFVFKLI